MSAGGTASIRAVAGLLFVGTVVASLSAIPPSAPRLTGPAGTPEGNATNPVPRSIAKQAEAGRAPWVVEENAKPGTTDWKPSGPQHRNEIEGYASTTSATHGETVRLYVSTGAAAYTVEAYRMGWYGGKQGRLIWKSPTLKGRRQPAPVVDARTNLVEARWAPSLDVRIDGTWPPGSYLFKLSADTGHMRYIPLTVRWDRAKAALLIVNAVTTWQAYNTWGGHSLYAGTSAGPSGRATMVSFDRPYVNDSGAGDFLGNELPLVSMVEREGYDVDYWTDIDLHERGDKLTDHQAVVTLGHDEYWSLEMRNAVERARDRGVNVVFFGANAVFRSIRLEPSDRGPLRRQVNYRSAREDPMTGVDNARVTVSWREAPVARPESSLVGTYYECNPVKADMVVSDPSAWVFAGTNLQAGDRLANVVGPEYDRYRPDVPQPPGPVQVLAHSPLTCRDEATYSDMTYYSTPSGSGVFATGTNWWISRLARDCVPTEPCPLEENVERITRNVLDVFARGPAGRAHPSEANYTRIAGA